MTVIVSFDNYTPVPRYDTIPWTDALIQEAPLVSGDWTLIDTISLTPPDADPSEPAARSFTTVNGTGPDLWYRVIFQDASLNQSLPTVPLENSSTSRVPYATAEELATILHVTQASNQAALDRVLAAAAAEIDSELGRDGPFAVAPDIVVEVNLERAVEHWHQMKSPFGILGLGAESGPAYVSRDTWERHACKLEPYKVAWGVA